jgi:hypothetical protein
MTQRIALLLFLAFPAFAEHRYIIPMFGLTPGAAQNAFWSDVSAWNRSGRTATVRVEAVYPYAPAPRCTLPETWTIPPRGYAELATGVCSDAVAATIVSDEPLIVHNAIRSYHSTSGREFILDAQSVQSPSAWLPAGVEAVAHGDAESADGPRSPFASHRAPRP